MPIRRMKEDYSFGPEAVALLNTAYEAACNQLDIKDSTTREVVARRVIDLGQGARDPNELCAAVIASFATDSKLPWR